MKRMAFTLAACLVATLAIVAHSWAQEPEPTPDPDTLHTLAELHADAAEYEESARLYEQFAAQEPSDVRAPEAFRNAYLFRLGLDQRDAAKRDLVAYERLYGPDHRNDLERAAGIFWTQHDLLDSTKARRRHALEYLTTYDLDGGIDRAIVAHAVIGQIDWRASCRQPLLLDSCISIEREPARAGVPKPPSPTKRFLRPERCGLPTQSITTVHRRDAKLAAAAQDRFTKISKLARRVERDALPETDLARREDFKDAWGMAMVYQADARYEDFLRIDVPEDLDFFVGPGRDSGDPVAEQRYRAQVKKMEDSSRVLGRFFDQKFRLVHDIEASYMDVKSIGHPGWVLAAAARTASLHQDFADQLYRAKLPRGLREPGPVKAYCDKLADYAKPIEDQALQVWEYCVSRSTEFQYFTEFSRLCEAELEVRDPKRYPATHELFGESVYAGTGLKSVGVLPDE